MLQGIQELNKNYDIEDITKEVIFRILEKYKIDITSIKNKEIKKFLKNRNKELRNNYLFDEVNSLKEVEKVFETIFEVEDKKANGIVFTPEYIADYIIERTVKNVSDDVKIIDPSCGCGAFILRVVEYLHKLTGRTRSCIIEKNIYGLDIKKENIKGLRILLNVLCICNGEDNEKLNMNIEQADSLRVDWSKKLKVKGKFDYIIGNPPYVNTHSLTNETVNFLKENYTTTKQGCFNIFYAFVEKSLQELKGNGELGFIVPNNFITISSACSFRKHIKQSKSLKELIDLGTNMVFKPVRTYNSIILMNLSNKKSFKYSYIDTRECNKDMFLNNNLIDIDYESLDDYHWHLLDNNKKDHIKSFHAESIKIGEMIKTGIATLRDKLYIIDNMNDGNKQFCVKKYNNMEYEIERTLIRPLLKISKVKNENSINENKKGIIFPYEKTTKYQVIGENEMKIKYPNAYKYLSAVKGELHKRDKENSRLKVWYEYGRSQGINNEGYKLIFPTFSDKPKFMLDMNNSLICNGYALYNSNIQYLRCIQKILNSHILEEYINRTSYKIKGDYACYQKKFIQEFTVPEFSRELVRKILLTQDEEEVYHNITSIYNPEKAV